MTDKRRLDNGLTIRRPRKKTQLQNETRLLSSVRKFDDGCYTRLQFLRAASHSISHAEVLRDADGDTTDTDDKAVGGTQQREGSPLGLHRQRLQPATYVCWHHDLVWRWCHADTPDSAQHAQKP